MLGNIQQAMNRIEQIETRIEQGPQISSAEFQRAFDRASQAPVPQALAETPAAVAMGDIKGVNPQMWQMMQKGGAIDPSAFGASVNGNLDVQPLAQQNGISCGQTSVAMAVNSLTGQHLTDTDINNKYGFELLGALNSETSAAGYQWKDGGDLSSSSWDLIDHKVNQEKTPVIVALNGPEFSPSGRGHIVTIVKTEGNVVTFADPATGALRTTTKEAMTNAPQHPDGNFVFYANRDVSGESYLASR